MRTEAMWKATNATVIGTGLIALDVVLNERRAVEPRLWTGGTCGNVLAILAYLGWQAHPVSRLKSDAASRLIHKDLKRWGVDTRLLSVHPVAPTPIIVHRLRLTAQGEGFHSFSLHCPDCGAHLPSFRPVPLAAVDSLPDLPSAKVFFADRVSAGILALAQRCAKAGALVVFEPSGIGDEALFERMMQLAHVVKYSNDRLADLPMRPSPTTCLEVQTLGKGGLRYRSSLAGLSKKTWLHCDAYGVQSPTDTAGAGDWCSAGILHVIGRGGLRGLKRITSSRLESAMHFGQALASWNCGFEGARGGMYERTHAQFRDSVTKILHMRANAAPESEHIEATSIRAVAGVCADCRRDERRSVLSRLHAAS
jgi:sugar/nucleoside kinase (ribokinase family)